VDFVRPLPVQPRLVLHVDGGADIDDEDAGMRIQEEDGLLRGRSAVDHHGIEPFGGVIEDLLQRDTRGVHPPSDCRSRRPAG
jgi:hypothetical protein